MRSDYGVIFKARQKLGVQGVFSVHKACNKENMGSALAHKMQKGCAVKNERCAVKNTLKSREKGLHGVGCTESTPCTPKKKQFQEKIKHLLVNPTEEEMQSLYELYEERAAIIEYDGGYCKEVVEKLALEEIRRLCIAKTKGIDDEGLVATGMDDKDGTAIKVKVNDDITRIEENTEKYPPYLKEKTIVKGIDLELPKIKNFFNKSIRLHQ